MTRKGRGGSHSSGCSGQWARWMQSWKRIEVHWHQDSGNKWSLCGTWWQCVWLWTQGSCRSDVNIVGETCTVHGYKLWTGHQQQATEQVPSHAYQISPYFRSLGKTCHLRTDGLHQTREHTKGLLIKASHPGSCSCTWSRPWCTYATCNFG